MNAMPKQQAMPQGGQMPSPMPGQQGQAPPNASPDPAAGQQPQSLYQKGGAKGGQDEQAQYDMFMANGISLIHDPKISEGLIKRIARAKDPTDAIARATFDIVQRLDSGAKQSGMELSPTVLINGANELMGEIITLAETAGMKPLSDEQKYQSFSLATAMYLDDAVKSGKITPEQLQQMGQEAGATPEGQKIAQQIQGQGGGGPPQGGSKPPTAMPGAGTQPPGGGGLLQNRGM